VQRAQLISRGFENRDANGDETEMRRAVLLPQGFSHEMVVMLEAKGIERFCSEPSWSDAATAHLGARI
jgi:hypothetical protein